jgi:hypothetical protein
MLDDLLSPLSGVNFSDTYDSYSSIIDLFIYAILFIGLAQVTIGKRFESNGGKAMVVAIGMVLAIGLAISESVLGFNLRSFGPLAAAIFIFLVGLVIFLGIKGFGMEAVGAASITIVITYFSIRSITPGLFDWMLSNPNMAWLHSVLLIAVIISVYKIIRLLFPGRDETMSKGSKTLVEEVSYKPRDFLDHLREEKNEKNFIKAKLEKITKEAGKDLKQIISDLIDLRKYIIEFGGTTRGREMLARKVESIIPKEHQVQNRIQTIKDMVQRLSNFDSQNFENLKEEYKNIPSKSKKHIERELQSEWRKMDIEKQIIKLEEAVMKYDHSFNHALKMTIVSLKSNRIKSSLQHLDEAIKSEKQLLKSFQHIERLEKKLKTFTMTEIEDISKIRQT